MIKTTKTGLFYAFITTIFWGIWGAYIEVPEKAGFPATLGYVVWSLTMIIPVVVLAIFNKNWKPEKDLRSILLGLSIGLSGAGGQLILFEALRDGPAYIVFPIISLFPVLTIALSLIFLKEKTGRRQWLGITFALIAAVLLANPKLSEGVTKNYTWLWLAALVFIMWGVQAYIMKFANNTMKAETIFLYMTISALALIPVAIYMTDFSKPVYLGFKGPYLAAMVHVLNSIGALMLVYALRYGKAIIVVPLTGLSPVITVVLSLLFYSVIPGTILTAGLIIAAIAIFLLSE